MSRATGLGMRTERTSVLCPSWSPGPSSSCSRWTSGSMTASLAAIVGRCRETVHGWAATESRGRSGQTAKALPSLAELSALSHHCIQATRVVGSDQDR